METNVKNTAIARYKSIYTTQNYQNKNGEWSYAPFAKGYH